MKHGPCSARGALAPGRRLGGFTLIDLLIAMAIVGILAAIAIPSYSAYLVRSQRAMARAALLQVAQSMERYYTANGSYLNAGAFPLNAVGGAGCVAYAPADSSAPRYCVTGVPVAATGGFLLTATPCGDGAFCPANAATTFTDATCDQLTLDNTGARGMVGGTATINECWER